MTVTPYLFYEGRCAEAIAFYEKAIGARVTLTMHFRDAPPGTPIDPTHADKIMHATLVVGGSELLVSDGDCAAAASFTGFCVNLTTSDEAEAARWFHGLSQGGAIRMKLEKTFFAKSFGMCTDPFGVGWMVMVPA
jgi:PhnB protein